MKEPRVAESQNCIFCKIGRGETPAKLVVNSKEIVAFRDINPQAPTHILIVPKRHVGSLDDVRAIASLGVAGIIVGRALYTGAIRLADALAAAEAA